MDLFTIATDGNGTLTLTDHLGEANFSITVPVTASDSEHEQAVRTLVENYLTSQGD